MASISPIVSSMAGTAAESLTLYAYGPGIGGLPLISAGGAVFVGNGQNLNSTEAAPIEFTINDDGTWRAFPNLRINAAATWSDLILSIPAASASSKEVQLIDSDTDGRVTDGFDRYGSILFHTNSDGSMEMAWSLQASATSDIWNLLWNVTDESPGIIPITIKSTLPSWPPSSSKPQTK